MRKSLFLLIILAISASPLFSNLKRSAGHINDELVLRDIIGIGLSPIEKTGPTLICIKYRFVKL